MYLLYLKIGRVRLGYWCFLVIFQPLRVGKGHFTGKYPEIIFLFIISFYNFTELSDIFRIF